MKNLSKDISNNILTIGPDFKNHRGGVGAVLEVYSRYFEVFKFLPSFSEGTPLKKIFFFFFFLIKLIYRFLFDTNIKIVHVHGASYGSFYRKFITFLVVKFVFRKKYIYHIHGAEFQIFYKKSKYLSRQLIKFNFNHADQIICLSQSWYNFFNSNFNVKKIDIVPNIIDYPNENVIKSTSNELIFLFLGYIGNRKGIYDLIDVINKHKLKYKHKIKLIIGGNGEVELLEKKINQNGLFEIINYIGWVSDVQKSQYLKNCDVYILPSYNEGLPISILEAMSYGKPIISTKIGGIPEIVIQGRNGILIEPGDIDGIESSIDFFINNEDTLRKFGEESKIIIENYMPEKVLNKLHSIYKLI